ncbi:hypothetical protein [Bacillus toyonensis]|uniref:hypothetical protein n=1 Tax=Bacillus toyonensis TaxID=155322 RepID=UPI000BF0504B|nr:hypothetical protein [Bacillus toyonensis]PEL24343.1 hypothetical protein CN624_18325 [Bacillus toyonensis]
MKNTDFKVGTFVKHKDFDFEGIVVGHKHSQVVIEVTEGEAPAYERDGTYIACANNLEVIEVEEVFVYAVEMEVDGTVTRFATVEDYMDFMLFAKEVLA